jgi:hypothetical protein
MSIRLRLMLWYGTLFAVILLFVGLFSYAFHTRGHYDDFDRALPISSKAAADWMSSFAYTMAMACSRKQRRAP